MTSKETKKHYDIALLGVAIGANYGSMLTYYSISETLKSLGKSVLIVNKINANSGDPEAAIEAPGVIFAKHHNDLSKVYTYENLNELNELADTFVIGTDQVWNYGIAKGAKNSFYLDFVQSNKRKISLASSFGHPVDFVPSSAKKEIEQLFQKFNAISVREDSGVDLLQNKYNVEATQIIEPVFWTDNQKYLKLAESSQIETDKPYLLSYILDETQEKSEAIKMMAEKLGLEIKAVPDGYKAIVGKSIFDVTNGNNDVDLVQGRSFSPEDFLNLFAHAKYIITDSFHGTAFAVKFNKQFATIVNNARGSSRFDTLFRIIGIPERRFENGGELLKKIDMLNETINYASINQSINREVERAFEWIKTALVVNLDEHVKIVETEYEKEQHRLLSEIEYKFYRKSDPDLPISICVKLNLDGSISGLDSLNESFWRIVNNQLIILNSDYIATTIFELPRNLNIEVLKIEGQFIQNNQVIHVLEKI